MQKFWIYLSVGLLVSAAFFSAGMAEEALVNPSKDNTLYQEDTGETSNGAGDHIFAGRTRDGAVRRAVIAFDVSTIPGGSTVTSVTLTMRESRGLNGPQTVTLHALLKDWGEGASDAPQQEGAGTQAAAGDATWLHTFFNTSLWDTPGGDFSATESASAVVDTSGDYNWDSTAQLVADVQSWVDNPAANFGWLVRGNEDESRTAKRFNSRESANPPQLLVEYTPPAQTGGEISFAQALFTIDESAGSVSIGVTRSGGTAGEVSVSYTTGDDTATAGEDYTAAADTLTWADGEGGTKTFDVTIIDEADRNRFEGPELVSLTLSNPTGGAALVDPSSAQLQIDDDNDLTEQIFFPQFGNGDAFTSQINLLNTSADQEVGGRMIIRGDDGQPLSLNLNGNPVLDGEVHLQLAPSETQFFETDGIGALTTGTVTVESDLPLTGVVVFGGDFGLAGVLASDDFSNGFVGPVDTNLAGNKRTGVAIQNLEESDANVTVELVSADGTTVVATALVVVPALSKVAAFVDEDEVFQWDNPPDFSPFQGSIRVTSEQDLAAVMIQNRIVNGVSQFATLPVAEQ